jgi:hypothetical protein
MGGIGIQAPDSSNQFYIYRGYRDGSNRYTTWETGLPWSAFSNTSDTSGKLRIARVGSTAYAYYDNSGWQQLRTFAIGTGDVTVRIDTDSFVGNPTATMDYDNFTIASADKVIWNHFADKVYFEDSDSNRLYAEIETFNTATSAATYHFAVPTVPSGADTPITVNWDWGGRESS